MSEQYVVSARKYRPQTFDTVVGQEHITTTLKNEIRRAHLAHAYLFTGPRGVGKTTCARILAKTINCENLTPETEACGHCASCSAFSAHASFNVFELDAASNNKVDDIRELISQVRFTPQQGKYKVYIIDEVHMLSSQAFNAFLKTLEEPPSYAIFILATTEKHKVLPTILSRCQIFDFKRITNKDIVAHLEAIAGREGITTQEAGLHIIAQKSEGCMRDALSMLDRIASFTNGNVTYDNALEHLAILDGNFYFQLMDAIMAQDVGETLLLFDDVLRKGFEGDTVLEGLAEHLRNMLLCKDQRMVRLLDIPGNQRNLFFEKAAQLPPSFVLSALHQLNDAAVHYRTAINKRLHLEMCLIRLCYINQVIAPDEKKNDQQRIMHEATARQMSAAQVQPAFSRPEPETPQAAAIPQTSSAPDSPKSSPPTTPAAEPPNQTVSPSLSPGSRNRTGRRVLQGLDDRLRQTAEEALEKKEEKLLSEEEAANIFDSYRNQLRNENKSSLHTQFCMMRLTLVSQEEIRITAPNGLCEEYAKAQRDELIQWFRQATGRLIRVVTEVREDPDLQPAQEWVLSRPEVLEMMLQKSPNLARFKEALGLQLDY